MTTRYYDNGDTTTIVQYRQVGIGINAQAVYQRIVTTYTIAAGIIIDHEPQPVKAFYRALPGFVQ